MSSRDESPWLRLPAQRPHPRGIGPRRSLPRYDLSRWSRPSTVLRGAPSLTRASQTSPECVNPGLPAFPRDRPSHPPHGREMRAEEGAEGVAELQAHGGRIEAREGVEAVRE